MLFFFHIYFIRNTRFFDNTDGATRIYLTFYIKQKKKKLLFFVLNIILQYLTYSFSLSSFLIFLYKLQSFARCPVSPHAKQAPSCLLGLRHSVAMCPLLLQLKHFMPFRDLKLGILSFTGAESSTFRNACSNSDFDTKHCNHPVFLKLTSGIPFIKYSINSSFSRLMLFAQLSFSL